MLGAHCYWEVMGSRLDGTHTKKGVRCPMGDWCIYHVSQQLWLGLVWSTWLIFHPLLFLGHMIINMYSTVATSHRAGKVDVFHRMILASTPSRGPFVIGVRPMPQSLPPRAPLWTSPLRRHAVAASVAAGPSCRSATCAGQPCERCAQCEQHSAAWLELFRSFVEDTHLFPYRVCKYKLAIQCYFI